MEERGRLLYDESLDPLFKRRSTGRLAEMIVFTSLPAIVFVLVLWTYVFTADVRMALLLVLLGVAICLIGFASWSLWRLSLHAVRIYENGIGLPPKIPKELKRGEAYIPFDIVERAYIGRYTAFELKEGGTEYVDNRDLRGFDEFASALKGRVEIERHASWEPGIGVVWHRPDRFEADELGFEVSWQNVVKRVAFDDVKSLAKGLEFSIMHFRDGSDFKIELKEDVSRRLLSAWKEYEERFWRDHEDEEKRWEKLETDQ